MEQKISRRIIASIMCASLALTFVPAFALSQAQSAFAAATTKTGPAICNVYTEGHYDEDGRWRDGKYEGCIIPDGVEHVDIESIHFENTINVPDDAEASCDASEAKDESVMCWVISTSDGDEDEDYDENYDEDDDEDYDEDDDEDYDEDYDKGPYDLYYGADGLYPSLPSNSTNLFSYMLELESIDGFENVDTSNVTNMHSMFEGDYDLSEIELENINTSNVTNMSSMFSEYGSDSLNLSSFDTSNVTDMSYMFNHCYADSLDLSSFDTSNVADMSGMFRDCNFKNVDLSNFDTVKVKNMASMFQCCDEVENLNISSFDTSSVEDMSEMFSECELQCLNIAGFNTKSVKKMNEMFKWDDKLVSIYASNKFKVANDCDSSEMFRYASSLKGDKGTKYNPDYADGEYARVDGGKSAPGYFSSANNVSVNINDANCIYGGSAKTPNLVVKCGQSILKQGKDYTVSYSGDRKSVGTHKLALKGYGAYSFSITKNYVVSPKAVSLKSVAAGSKALTLKWTKSSKANASGYQIQIAKNKKFSKGKKTVSVKGYKASSKKISKLGTSKKYFVKVRAYKTVGGNTYYSVWSKVLSKKTK